MSPQRLKQLIGIGFLEFQPTKIVFEKFATTEEMYT